MTWEQPTTARGSRSSSRAPSAAASTRSTTTCARSRSRTRTPRIDYVPPKAEEHGGADRASRASPTSCRPRPPRSSRTRYGVELGVLMQMLRDTAARNLRALPAGGLLARLAAASPRRSARRPGVAPAAGAQRDHAARRPRSVHRAIQAHEDHGAADGLHRADRRGADRARAARRGEGRLLRRGHAARRRSTAATRSRSRSASPTAASCPADEPITASTASPTACRSCTSRAPAPSPRRSPAPTGSSYELQQPRGALPLGPDGAAGAHRERLGAVHLREQGGDRALPRDHQGDPARAAGVRPPGGACTSASAGATPTRRKKRAYIEKYIPQVAIGLQQILGLTRRAARRVTVEDLDGRARAQQEGVGMAARKKTAKPKTAAARSRPRSAETRREAPQRGARPRDRRADQGHGRERAPARSAKHQKPDLAFPVRSLGNVSYAQGPRLLRDRARRRRCARSPSTR